MMQERGKARRIVGVWIQATFLLSSFFFFPDKVVTQETNASSSTECSSTGSSSSTAQPCPPSDCNNKKYTERLAAQDQPCTKVAEPRPVVNGSSAAPPPPQHQIQAEDIMPPAPNPAYPPHTNFSNNNREPRTIISPAAHPPNSLKISPRLKIGKADGAKKIIAVVSVSISGAIIIAIAICCFLKRRFSQNGPNRDVENLVLQHTPKRYTYSEIKKMTKSFSDKLGQGGFGSVYKGTLPGGCHVAVKILTEIDSNGEEFINEVASITRTSHVNIVSLLGFCDEGNKRALVYEFMPNKSLDNFLGNHNGDGGFMDLKKLNEIAVGIAKGLEYLHTGCITRIVHFDIKPQNILLDEDLCPKISDFGLAKLCKKKQSVLSVLGTRGTAGYIAPEVFSRNFGGVSHKSDVYSYGMMLLEMAGAIKNAGTVVIQSSENYFPDRIYEKLMIDVTNDDLDDESMMIGEEEKRRKKMMLIGFWCIQTSPSERPSMSKVVEMLEGSLDFIQIPPKPSFCSPVIPDQENSSSSSSAHAATQNLAAD